MENTPGSIYMLGRSYVESWVKGGAAEIETKK